MNTLNIRYRCLGCGRAEQLKPPEHPTFGSTDSRARVRGWRFPPGTGTDDRQGTCPECTGDNETYWDDRTLTVALQAGIDVGRRGTPAHA